MLCALLALSRPALALPPGEALEPDERPIEDYRLLDRGGLGPRVNICPQVGPDLSEVDFESPSSALVVCEVPGIREWHEGELVAGSRTRLFGTAEGRLCVVAEQGSTGSVVHVPGLGFATLSWPEAEHGEVLGCGGVEVEPEAWIVGRVEGLDDLPANAQVVLSWRYGSTEPAADGSFRLWTLPGQVEVRARVLDRDALWRDAVGTVQVEEQGVAHLDLVLPDGPSAGLGARLVKRPGGIEIGGLFLEGGALQAGLQEGDRLLEVDGQDVRGFAFHEIRELTLGPPGTPVEVVVQRDGEELAFTVVRRLLGEPRPQP